MTLSSFTQLEGGKWVAVEEGAEAFLELLNANGVEYIFLNPGTDTFPVQEAIAKFQGLGKPTPKVVLCLHETTALSAAHGHFMVSGRPQVVLVHVDVGTQNVGGALHNAQRGRAAIILCAGRSPTTFERDIRGSRATSILWYQDQFHQAGIVQDYVKWSFELRGTNHIHHVVQRAFQIATTEPWGPVYLVLPREVLMEKIKGVKILPKERFGPASPSQADPEKLKEVAALLLQAQYPLVITANLGRHPQTVLELVKLAEQLALPVVESRHRTNFPSNHPLYLGTSPTPFIESADVLLIIDSDVPYIPSLVNLTGHPKIIQLDIDPIKQTIPLWGFPVDISIHAESSKAIPALRQVISSRLTSDNQERIETRRTRIQAQHREQREQWQGAAQSRSTQKPIGVEWLCSCINEVVDENTLVVDEAVTNTAMTTRYICSTRPGTYFQSGASSLGWGPGAALGAKLAAPDKTVFSLVGDGSFIFSDPIAPLWAADAYQAPFLTVIFNNQQYHAPKRALKESYKDSYSEQTGRWVGVDIVPPPRYQLIAEACRAYGETVTEPEQVRPALLRALEQMKQGKAAVLDVILNKP